MLFVHRLGIGSGDLARRGRRGRDLRQSEIQNLCVSALGDEDVSRLDVAVDDALGVGGIERVGDLDGEREDQIRVQRAIADAML